MGLANVNLTDTFDQQRVKINQGLLYLNQQNLLLNLTFDTTNAVFEQSNTDNVRLSAAYVVLNAAFTQANTDNVRLSAAYVTVNAAFDNVNTSVIAANNYAGFMANSGNNFAGAMANSANAYALTIDTASNTAAYGNIRVSTTAANAYTDAANAAAYANIRVSTTAANAYALSIDTTSNTAAYANIQATGASANAYALAIDTASNTAAYANIRVSALASNVYTDVANTAAYANIQATGAAANAYALATVTTANTAAYANIQATGAAANAYALESVTTANTAAYANIRVSTTAANAYTDVANVAAHANIRTSTLASNAYALSIDTASNTAAYANIQATGGAANAYALSIDTASNTAAYANIRVSSVAANTYANASFYTIANGEAAFLQANTANQKATDAYALAQTLGGDAANAIIQNQTSFAVANAAFDKANNALPNTTGAVFAGELSVTGNLGIGKASSSLRLDIEGDMRATGNILFGDVSSDYVRLYGGWIETANNIRIGNTTNILFIDQQNTRLGINTVAPTNTLDVNGGANVNILFVAGTNVGPTLSGVVTNAASAFGSANTAGSNANQAGVIANAAFGSANTVGTSANTAGTNANNAGTRANTAGTIANSAFGAANQAGVIANAAFGTANNALPKAGGTITGDLAITGNITVSGLTTYANTTQLNVGDNIITLNADIPIGVTPTESAGIEINRGNKNSNAAITWIETTSAWAFTSNTLNAYTTYIASNTDVTSATVAANNYAGVMANAANAIAVTIVGANLVTSRAYTNTSVDAANNYAGVMANGAGTVANNRVSSVTGTAGQIFSSGGLTPSLNLVTTAVVSSTYGGATQIPVITVDTFGRLTSAANVTVQGMDYPYVNTVWGYTNSAFTSANTAGLAANQAGVIANAAFNKANNAATAVNPTLTGTINIAGGNILSQTLTDAASISWNTAQGTVAYVTLAGDRTLSNPTNLKVGTYILHVIQDSNGNRTLNYGTAFKWPGGVAPILTTTGNARDLLSFVCDGTNLYGSFLPDVK